MKKLSHLAENDFVLTVMQDGESIFSEFDIDKTNTELPDLNFDEFQFYVHNVGFYLTHCLTWCKQLDAAVEFLLNYDYSKKLNTGEREKGDRFIYRFFNLVVLASQHAKNVTNSHCRLSTSYNSARP